jgi:hypothetical protein
MFFGLVSCKDEEPLKSGNKIIEFKVGDQYAAIDEINHIISITLPTGTALTGVTPGVKVSGGATVVSPKSTATAGVFSPEAGINFQASPDGVAFTVRSEDSHEATYVAIVKAVPATPAPTLEAISVTKLPAKVNYAWGEAVDYTGLEVTGAYSDGSTQDHSAAAVKSGYDPQAAGSQTILVAFGGKTAEFTVTVLKQDAKLESIVVYQLKPSYTVGEDLDAADFLVIGTYGVGDDATTARVTTGITFSHYDETLLTAQTVGVSVGDAYTTTSITLTKADIDWTVNVGVPSETEVVIHVAYPENGSLEGIELSVKDEDFVILSVPAIYSNVSWAIDEGGASYAWVYQINTGSLGYKKHTLTVRATYNGISYVTTIPFTVIF